MFTLFHFFSTIFTSCITVADRLHEQARQRVKIADKALALENKKPQANVTAGYKVKTKLHILQTVDAWLNVGPALWTWFPVNTKYLNNNCTMPDQRRKRWADVVQLLYKCFVYAALIYPVRGLSMTSRKTFNLVNNG